VAALEPGANLPDDQKARNNEEDVHPDEAARQAGDSDVIGDHRKDGDGAQPVDDGQIGDRIERIYRSFDRQRRQAGPAHG
jgi:hypothetical protein